jgi:hypothetical protein
MIRVVLHHPRNPSVVDIGGLDVFPLREQKHGIDPEKERCIYRRKRRGWHCLPYVLGEVIEIHH